MVSIGGQVYPSASYANPYRYLAILQVFASYDSVLQQQLLGGTFGEFGGRDSSPPARNSWGVGVFRYYFGYIPWTTAILKRAARLTRKIMRVNNSLHCNGSVARVYLPRKKGGRGISSVYAVYEQELVSAVCYLQTTDDPDLRALVSFLGQNDEKDNILCRAQTVINKYVPDVVLSDRGPIDEDGEAIPRNVLVRLVRAGQWEKLEEELLTCKIHGTYQQ